MDGVGVSVFGGAAVDSLTCSSSSSFRFLFLFPPAPAPPSDPPAMGEGRSILEQAFSPTTKPDSSFFSASTTSSSLSSSSSVLTSLRFPFFPDGRRKEVVASG